MATVDRPGQQGQPKQNRTKRAPRPAPEFVVSPFTVLIDTREQAPFSFQGFKADSRQQNLPLVIPTKVCTLQTGDYSLTLDLQIESNQQLEPQPIAIERKSLQDAYQTFIHERDRFERELERLQQLGFAAVVIEAGWSRILNFVPHGDPDRVHTKRKSFFRSIISWQQRYRTVQWWMCVDRRHAEAVTFRMLERFARERIRERREREKGDRTR